MENLKLRILLQRTISHLREQANGDKEETERLIEELREFVAAKPDETEIKKFIPEGLKGLGEIQKRVLHFLASGYHIIEVDDFRTMKTERILQDDDGNTEMDVPESVYYSFKKRGLLQQETGMATDQIATEKYRLKKELMLPLLIQLREEN